MRSRIFVFSALTALASGGWAAPKGHWPSRHRLPPVIRSIDPGEIIFQGGTSNPEQFPTSYSATIRGARFRRGDIVQCDGIDLPKRLTARYRSSHALEITLTENDIRGATHLYEGVTARITIYDPVSKAVSNTALLKVSYHMYGG
jgi:hypothetical protein